MIKKLSRAITWLREGLAELRADLADTFTDLPRKLRYEWDWLRFRDTEPYETDDEFIASVAHLLPPAAVLTDAELAECRAGGADPGQVAAIVAAVDPRAALDGLTALWSDDFDAYASGRLDASEVHCALCMCAPCRCPAFGTPEYMALVNFRHGRNRSAR